MSYFRNLTQSNLFKKTGFYLTRTQQGFTCLKLTIETPEQTCKIYSKLTYHDIRTMSMNDMILVSLLLNVKHCSAVSVADIEQVNTSWTFPLTG